MRLFILFLSFFLSLKSFSQTVIYNDDMENPSTWRGVSTTGVNSGFIGGLSSGVDNPPNSCFCSSVDSCYIIRGVGLGSSSIEADTFIYPNVSLISGRQYQIRFKIASIGVNSSVQTAAGVDATDWIELQYTVNNGLSWWRDAQIQGNNNSMWGFMGAIGTGAMTNITRTGSMSTTTPTIYVSNFNGPIVNVWTTLPLTAFSQLRIRFVSRINASGETWLLDDVQILDLSVILPIELINFDISKEGEKIKIFWSTASEINNDYFVIYKSYDAVNFEEFGFIDGAGNSNNIINYYFYDYDKNNSIIYYKLKQVDYDGNFKEYPIIAFNNTFNKNKIIKILNYTGQEVNEDYQGLKILYFENGEVIKKL